MRTPIFEVLEARAMLSHDPGHLPTDHIHSTLAIYIEGSQVTIPDEIGIEPSRHYNPHTHTGEPGRIHIGEGPLAGIDPEGSASRFTTLEDFFDVWRTHGGEPGNNPSAVFTSTNILGYQADATHVVRFLVNGQPNAEYENWTFRDGDALEIRYEAIPPMPDFELLDVNTRTSATNPSVSPREYLNGVSAWYFIHST